jgi:hypothetical protein
LKSRPTAVSPPGRQHPGNRFMQQMNSLRFLTEFN